MDDALGCTFNHSYFYNTSNEVFLMLLFKSGDWFSNEKQIELTDSVCDFIHCTFDQFKGSTVEIHRKDLSDDEIVHAMVEYPKLIERPIVVGKGQAIIGRPPENVLSLFD